MILIIDNYDSFTYNLYQYLCELDQGVRVIRNDKTTVSEISAMAPSMIVISPGPGCPDEAGITLETIRELSGKIPILGVCLGHQSIGQVFGGRVIQAEELMHGKTSFVEHDGRTIFSGLDSPFEAMRYHSLTLEENSLPSEIEVSATGGGEIMGIRHRELPLEGVQFHPESIMTPVGKDILRNFIATYGGGQ